MKNQIKEAIERLSTKSPYKYCGNDGHVMADDIETLITAAQETELAENKISELKETQNCLLKVISDIEKEAERLREEKKIQADIDNAFFAEFRKENQQLRAPQWQTIESAPRDGTEVLVMCTMKKIGRPQQINCVANARWIERDDGSEFWHDLEGIMKSEDVEYWMPLTPSPTPPEVGL